MQDRDKETTIKGLPDDKEIIENLNHHLNETLTISQNWRQFEVKENFALFEGNQWTLEGSQRQAANGMPMITINRTMPVIEAICGYEVQNRLDIDYAPRMLNPEQQGFSDVVKPTVKYIEQVSKANSQYSLCFRDMLICGLGATSTVIDYDRNPDGEVDVRRVFPGFLFWDPSARAKNLIDANKVTEIKAVDREVLKQEYDIDEFDNVYTAALDARIIEFFDAVLAVKSLGIVYEHQWRQKEPFYRVENPFKKLDPMQIAIGDMQAIQGLKQQLGKQYSFNPDLDSVFSVEKDKELAELRKIFEIANVDFKYSTQHKFRYYRAVITGGKVIEKSENFHQKGFSIQFMSGQFSELAQEYYGLVRSCKDPQRMLNQTVSDFVGFLQTSPKGGVDIESDAVLNIEQFINTYTKAREVTVFQPGGLMKSRPKISATLPQGIMEMIQYADQQIMQVCGVTPELMGTVMSKEQNTSFLKQQIRQGLTTLATYFDAKYTYLQRQGELYIDCVRVLAENNEGRLIKNVLGDKKAKYLPLLADGIAAEYDVIVDEVPDTPDENLATFERLITLQGQMATLPNPVNIMPLALQYSELDDDIIEKLMTMMSPPPPQQPDPLNTALLQSQVQLQQANAQKIKADALNATIDAVMKHHDIKNAPVKNQIENDFKAAQTLSELSKVQSNTSNVIKTHLDHHIDKMMAENDAAANMMAAQNQNINTGAVA